MDVKEMEFEFEEFEAVIDKGTVDSVLCGLSSTKNVKKMLT